MNGQISSVMRPLSLRLHLSKRMLSSTSSKMSSEREKMDRIRRREYRFGYPEFLPDCERKLRNHTRELLERKDMLARRENVMLPEFYVGSIVAVTINKPPEQGPGKFCTRFLIPPSLFAILT